MEATQQQSIQCHFKNYLIKNPKINCARIDNIPITAIKIDTSTELKPIFSFKYTNIQEYWPASGKYDKNTVTHCIRIV